MDYGENSQASPMPGVPPRNSGQATAVMVLGIVGLSIFCLYGIGVIPAIVGLALAPGARRQIRMSGGTLTGEGFVKAGVICSWVTIGLLAATLVIVGVIWLVSM